MTSSTQAAQILLANRITNPQFTTLPADICPQSIDDAFAIHRQMETTQTIAGWKCLLPPDDEKVIAAPIFTKGNINTATDTADELTCQLIADKNLARVEPEIAFILAADLPARSQAYSEAEINNAIASANMALELMQDRYATDATPSFFERLADCMFNQGIFIGPELNLEQAMQTNQNQISIQQAGAEQVFAGKHPNGAAINPVYWFVNYMREKGVDLKAGQAIITGSFCGIVELEFNQLTTINYQGLGEYKVTFTQK
ncbi:hydratase [Catenovulum sp. 2E275]|uniref:hydratase n=1 Tax=Catenovulum sp. 2E275 TaxID=2980497 RepID=UPI0021D0F903|nr:hydratase [Catenovulum sp. 2E275]MCU4677011.1 hydratase [Catenovulum sp. 2E275]